MQTQPTLSELSNRLNRAETAEEIAEICRLEAEIMGGPFFCPACGVALTGADTIPCRMDHDAHECGVIKFGLGA